MNDLLYRARTAFMTTLLARLRRTGPLTLGGIPLRVDEGVHHPAPVFGLGFTPLQEAALGRLPAGARVLELGTGAGFWALAAARRGCQVTATDLPSVPLGAVQDAARGLGVEVRTLHSDLFGALGDARFDAVLFNPPFHDAAPSTPEEAAWCGGAVMRRFLAELPAHLDAGGAAYVLLPRAEQERYAQELSAFAIERPASRWYPFLGRVDLLRLAPRG